MTDYWNKTCNFVPIFLIFGLYIFTLSNNFSLTHDSIQFLLALKAGDASLHPNHLLYLPFLNFVVRVWSFLGTDLPVHIIVEAVGTIAGTLTLLAGYLILTRRFDVLRWNAMAAIAVAAMTYGVWYYSVAIEIYIFPLCLLTWTFFVLTAPELNWRGIAIAAVLHSTAMLFPQTAALFSVVPLIVLLTRRPNETARVAPFGRLLLYVGIGTIIVSVAYWSAANSLGHAGSVDEFVIWFLGYGTHGELWSSISLKTLFLAATGFSRALIGGHFMFGIPALRGPLESAFSGNSLEDEAFLVQGLPAWACYALAGLAILAAVLLIFLTIRAGLLLARKQSVMPRHGLVLLIAWLVPYTLFSLAFVPVNADFWVVQGFVTLLLVAGSLQSRDAPDFQPAKYLAVLATALFFVNGAGTAFPASNPKNDFYRANLTSLQNHLTAKDYLLIGDSWPLRNHLRLHTKVEFGSVSDSYREQSPEAIVTMLNARLKSGQRVFLARIFSCLLPRHRNFTDRRMSNILIPYGTGFAALSISRPIQQSG